MPGKGSPLVKFKIISKLDNPPKEPPVIKRGITGNYILDDDHNPVVMDDAFEWARWFEDTEKRRVARTELDGGVLVSTVFLGLDHNFFGSGPPILFETMIFGGKYDQYMQRYSTWKEAEEGHEYCVKMVLRG